MAKKVFKKIPLFIFLLLQHINITTNFNGLQGFFIAIFDIKFSIFLCFFIFIYSSTLCLKIFFYF